MANYQKYTRGQCPQKFSHYARTLSENANKDIDSSQTKLNYNLAESSFSQNELLKKRLSEVKCLKRKDVNVMCSWVVTLPKDFKGNEKDFFKATYDFLESKYKKENVISAWVHKDETQPHIHFTFVPVVLDKKKNIEKVSAKECVTKMDLISFHEELQKYLEKELGQEVHILNGATPEKNLSVRELKVSKREEEVKTFEESKAAAADFIKSINEEVKPLPKLENISNIGTVERLEKNFPLQKTGTLKKESAYEYGNRMTNNIFDWVKTKFYEPLRKKCNHLLEHIKTLKQDNDLKNKQIKTLKAENQALNQSVDKIVDQRLESRSKAFLERSKAEIKSQYAWADNFINGKETKFNFPDGHYVNLRTGIKSLQKITKELVDLESITPYGLKKLAEKMESHKFESVADARKYAEEKNLESITDIPTKNQTRNYDEMGY